MQAQKSVHIVPVRVIALAFALLAALLLASAAGYVLRGAGTSTTSTPVALPTLHFKQQTDNMMEREHNRLSPTLTSPYGAGK